MPDGVLPAAGEEAPRHELVESSLVSLQAVASLARVDWRVSLRLRKTTRYVMVLRDNAWLGLAWLDLAWLGLAWLGLAWH